MEADPSLSLTPAQILAMNLTAALQVAGPPDEEGRPQRLNGSRLQRDTGIARSTLRALKQGSADSTANPDLRTLCRLADELQIPVAFLLMGPRQWQAMIRAMGDMQSMLTAADKVAAQSGMAKPQSALQILRTLKVYPLPLPVGESGEDTASYRRVIEQSNESRRRATLVTAALAQTAARDPLSYKTLTAFAAALANHNAAGTSVDSSTRREQSCR